MWLVVMMSEGAREGEWYLQSAALPCPASSVLRHAILDLQSSAPHVWQRWKESPWRNMTLQKTQPVLLLAHLAGQAGKGGEQMNKGLPSLGQHGEVDRMVPATHVFVVGPFCSLSLEGPL